jgi:hypothetical protein
MMKEVGHKSELIHRRYIIVSECDIREAPQGLEAGTTGA